MYNRTQTHKKTPSEFLDSLNEEIIKYLWNLEDKNLALDLLKIQYYIIEQKNKLNK